MFELILGGVRSGKSRLAQERAMQLGGTVTYLATATTNGWKKELANTGPVVRPNGYW